MTFLEKSNWVVLIVAVATLVIWMAFIVPRAISKPIAEIDWVQPMIYSIVGFIAVNVLGNVIAAASNPKEADKKDQRDKEIDHFGERVGNWLIVAGSVAALILAMLKADHFWIGNTIYVAGIFGALGASSTKILAYHGPFQRW